MPRKPSSVFIIRSNPGTPTTVPMETWRVEIGADSSIEAIVTHMFPNQPTGTRLFVVEDTKVDAYDVTPTITQVDDPRLANEP